MPQPRIHTDNAKRQAAYRQRRGRLRATQAELAGLAETLHFVLQDAVEYNTFPLPYELVADRSEVTMSNLIRFFDPIYDPVRNPNGKLQRKHRSCKNAEANIERLTP